LADLGRRLNKSNQKWLEVSLTGIGLLLLVAFFVVRSDQDQLRVGGLIAFAEANETSASMVHSNSPSPGGSIGEPDYALWSDNRISAYKESLKKSGDAPQAVLKIEKLKIEVPVYNGADELNMNRGVGRILGTARFDKPGNLGIAGHRDGFFRGLKDISKGDVIELQTAEGLVQYTVSSIDIVDPADVSVLAPTDDRTLTLVTCYPFYFVGHAPQRFIVKATAGQLLAANQVRAL
jgi:sortase A